MQGMLRIYLNKNGSGIVMEKGSKVGLGVQLYIEMYGLEFALDCRVQLNIERCAL